MNQGLNAAATAQLPRHLARMAAEIKGQGKAPLDVVEAVRQTLRHLAEQKIVFVQVRRRAVAVPADGTAVEDFHRWRFPRPAHEPSRA